jgi:DNA-binding GntR family transcriptional regulator
MARAQDLNLPTLPGMADATASQRAYRRLRHGLMIGRVRPGVALTIRGLAEALEMSPTPVREALRRLMAECALTELDNRRVIVPEMNARKFEELLALRVALEVHAAERALPYINHNIIEEMERVDARTDDALSDGDSEGVIMLNQRFHTTLYTTNPDQLAMPMIESVWLQLGPFLRLATPDLDKHYTVDRHKEAIEALRQRDPIALSIAVEADIRDGISHIGREGLLRAFVEARGAVA